MTSSLAFRIVYAAMVLSLAAACMPAADTDSASAPATEPAAPVSDAAPAISGPAAPNTTDTLSNAPPEHTAAPSAASAAPAPSPEELASGRSAYARACAMCHGPAGQGTPAGVALTQRDVALVAGIIVKGGEKMPPMAAVLSGDEVDDVSKFVAAGLPQ